MLQLHQLRDHGVTDAASTSHDIGEILLAHANLVGKFPTGPVWHNQFLQF